MTDAPPPPPISGKVKLFIGGILALMLTAAIGVGFLYGFASTGRVGASGAIGHGLSPMPFDVLRSERALGWTYSGCRLDSDAFANRNDLRLAFNAIGNMEPEETPVALRASSAFLACVVRKATETCDTEVRDRLTADMVTFFRRHGRTHRLVERMTGPGAHDGTQAGAIRTFPGFRSVIKDRQAEAASVLSIADSKVGYALQNLVETGFVKPSQFGWLWKPEAITRHLDGIKPGISGCKVTVALHVSASRGYADGRALGIPQCSE
jgi:hypothetical protein